MRSYSHTSFTVLSLWTAWLYCYCSWLFSLSLVTFDELCLKGDMQWFYGCWSNCSSSAFNIIKSIWILRNIKNKTILEKSIWKCTPDDLFTFASDDVIPGKQTTKQPSCWVLSVDCRPIAVVVTFWSYVERLQLLITGKITFYQVSVTTQTKNKCILIWHHAWRWAKE